MYPLNHVIPCVVIEWLVKTKHIGCIVIQVSYKAPFPIHHTTDLQQHRKDKLFESSDACRGDARNCTLARHFPYLFI